MSHVNFKLRSEKGVSFVEYAIALSALMAVFIVVNSFIKEAFEQRAQKIIETSDDMPTCQSSGSIINSTNPEACL